jgi:thiamine kinase-like enzyme
MIQRSPGRRDFIEWKIVAIDWTGAGMVPRVFSLGSLLWAAGWTNDTRSMQRVDAVCGSYRKYVELSPEEISRLYASVVHQPIIFDDRSLCSGRKALREVTKAIENIRQIAQTIALRAADALKS